MAVSTNSAFATLLDDFNRSNTGPPPSGSWGAGSFSSGTSGLQVVSNAVKRGGAGWSSGYWGTQIGPDCICVVTVPTLGDFSIILRGQTPGSAAWDGYELLFTSASNRWDINRDIDGAATSLANVTQAITAGDKVGFEVTGTGATVTLNAARYTAGAWGADFLSTTDVNAARIVASGYAGLWMNGTTPVLDDFSAGTITSSTGTAANLLLLGVG